MQVSEFKIRWMLSRDMPAVLDIEADSFESPWLEGHFICCLWFRNCIGMVAERDKQIVGIMVYMLKKHHILLLNLCVAAGARRQGVGTAMIDRIKEKLGRSCYRKTVAAKVRERNLAAQLFFRKNGFRAASVIRDYYEDTSEDAYLMRFTTIGETNNTGQEQRGKHDVTPPRSAATGMVSERIAQRRS